MPNSKIEILEEAARRGAAAIRPYLDGVNVVQDKGSGDFATQADLESQEAILGYLTEQLPNIPHIAEEQSVHGALPKTFLTVDPLDGTIIFSRRCQEWGILIGSVEDGVLDGAVLAQPQLNRIISVATTGRPLLKHFDGTKIRELTGQLPGVGGGGRPAVAERYILALDINMYTTPSQIISIANTLVGAGRILLTRSIGASVAATAELLLGHVDLYLNPFGGKIWDFAPCAHAVTAAGGAALTFDPETLTASPFKPDRLQYGVLFAGSAEIAEDVLTTLRAGR